LFRREKKSLAHKQENQRLVSITENLVHPTLLSGMVDKGAETIIKQPYGACSY
jgi:hypothetical protein